MAAINLIITIVKIAYWVWIGGNVCFSEKYNVSLAFHVLLYGFIFTRKKKYLAHYIFCSFLSAYYCTGKKESLVI